MKEQLKDWFSFLICLAGTFAAVYLFFTDADAKAALAVGFFFGFGSAFMGSIIINNRRFDKGLMSRTEASVTGNRPYWFSRRKFNLIGIALVVMGILYLNTDYFPWPMTVISVFLIFAGIAFLLKTNVPGLRRGLMFTPEGIWMLEPWGRYCLHWDNILRADIGHLNAGTALFLRIDDDERLFASLLSSSKKPDFASKKLRRRISRNLTYNRVHELFLPQIYGLETASLYYAALSYIADPERRQELA